MPTAKPAIKALTGAIVDVPDFPKPGVVFKDITPILASPKLFRTALKEFTALVNLDRIDVIGGIEARGFILGSALAARTGKGFVPLRKLGKLPPPAERSQAYSLEYGLATLEVKRGTGRMLMLDDVLATGGTLKAGIELCGRAGYKVADVAVLIDLRFLNDLKWDGKKRVKSVIHYG